MKMYVFIDTNRIRISPATKLIKAGSYTTITKSEDIISQVNIKAEKILRIAQENAERMLAEAEKVYLTEKERGYSEGIKKSEKEMATEMSTLAINTEKYLSEIEQQITALVLNTVKKVIGDLDQGELIRSLVKNSLAAMRNHKFIKLKISPTHIDFLNSRINEMLNAYPNIHGIEIIADDRLSQNQLILESPIGIVDSSIESQLSAIKDAFERGFPK